MEDDDDIFYVGITDLEGREVDPDDFTEEEITQINESLQEYMDIIASCDHEYVERYEAALGRCQICEKCGLTEILGQNH